MKKPIKYLLIFLFLVVAVAVAGLWPLWLLPATTVPVAYKQPLPAPSGTQFVAGIAETDITPPPGIPKFGYASWARDGDGFRTRLKARAFYFRDAHNKSLAIIQLDLGSGSLLLHHKVAEAVAEQTDIGFENLALVSTHTHSGPGLYLHSDLYNLFGSNKPGFDPQLFDFLVTQLSSAVIEAAATARPARIATGQVRIDGVSRNRSPEPYQLNYPGMRFSSNSQMLDPVLTMTRIDLQAGEGEFKPAGVLSNFPIHGTGIPPFTSPYHGDVWAFFERDIENNIVTNYAPPWKPVHGTYEGAHGDTTPAWREGERGDLESRRLGKLLSKSGWELFMSLEAGLTEDVALDYYAREINLADGKDHSPLCPHPVIGTAVVGAAQGDEVFPIAWIPPFQEGWPRTVFTDGCHAEKRWFLSRLQTAGLGIERYPHRLFLQSLRLGKLTILALPFEVTTESGRRIVETARQSIATDSAGWIIIASLSNGYFGYATTREEYSLQWYEGGHTIYGPGTQEFLASESAGMLAAMENGRTESLPASWKFKLLTKSYFPESQKAQGKRTGIQQPVYASEDGENFWRFSYLDVNPSKIQLHLPLLSIETKVNGSWQLLKDAGTAVNDQGYDMQLIYRSAEANGMGEYEARWYHPPATGEGIYRFRVEPRGEQETLYSEEFQ